MAEENSFDLEMARESVRSAIQRKKDAVSRLFPTLGASLSKTIDNSRNNNFDSDWFNPSLNLDLPLFNNGQRFAQLSEAEASLTTSRMQLIQKWQELILQVARKYYALALSEEARRLQKEALDARKRDHDRAVLRYRQGDASQLEVLSAEAAKEQSQLELHRAKSKVEKARMDLNMALGIETNTRVEIDSTEIKTIVSSTDMSWQECSQTARDKNLMLKRKDKMLELAELRVDRAKKERLPSLSANAFAGQNPFDPYNQEVDYGVTLRLSYTIFDGGRTSRKIASAKRELAKTKRRIVHRERQIISKLRKAYAGLQLSRKKLNLAQTNLSLARKRARKAKKSYKQGAAPFKEMLETAQREKRARLEMLRTKRDHILAVFNLKLIMGTLLSEKDILPSFEQPEDEFTLSDLF